MKQRQWIILGSIVGILGLGLVLNNYLASLNPDQPPRKPEQKPLVAEVKHVRYTDEATSVLAFGRVVTDQPVTVVAEVQGRLLPGEVKLKPGVPFRKGQLLFRQDDTDTRLAMQSDKSELIQQTAQMLPDFRVDFPERFDVWNRFYEAISVEQPLPPLPEFATSKERTFVATRGVLTRYYQIKSTEAQLRKFAYRAPYNGSIAEVFNEVGAVLTPGTQVLRLLNTGSMEVELSVRVENLKWVELGKPVQLQAQEGAGEWSGRVERIGDYVSEETQAVNVYLSVRNTRQHPLYEGMYVQGRLPGKVVRGVFEVPRKAVIDNRHVWIARGGKLVKAPVRVHKTRGTTALVSGPDEGARVLTSPPVNAREGMPVTPTRTQAAG